MTTPLPVRAVLFDLDDTLHDRDAAFGSWLANYLEGSGPQTLAERQSLTELVVSLDGDGYGSKVHGFNYLAKLTGVADVERKAGELYEQYLAQMRLFPDVIDLLDRLDRSGIKYGIVTNGSRRQMEKIIFFGLDKRTPCLFVSSIFGADKPDPSIFRAALRSLGAHPETSLMVGDNPWKDIAGGTAAGMRTAWIHRGKPWPEELAVRPDFVLETVGELVGVLGLE